ncbi:hypothetical protein ACFL55_02350 [Candidatus Latescibacterota bacterium]
MNDESIHSKTDVEDKMLKYGVISGIVGLIAVFPLLIVTGIIMLHFFPSQRQNPSSLALFIQILIISFPFFFTGKLAYKYLPPHFPKRYVYKSTSAFIPMFFLLLILINSPVGAGVPPYKLIEYILYFVRIFSPFIAYIAGIEIGKRKIR